MVVVAVAAAVVAAVVAVVENKAEATLPVQC